MFPMTGRGAPVEHRGNLRAAGLTVLALALFAVSDAIVKLLTTLNHEMGMTTVISTHDRSVAEHASRVIEMRDGKVVSDSGSGDGAPADRLATA